MARQQLMLLLKAGYSPLRFYVHDISKYFYLGELLALVDLSLVNFMPCPGACGSSEMLSTMLMCLKIFISTNMGLRTDCQDGSTVQPVGWKHPESGNRKAPEAVL